MMGIDITTYRTRIGKFQQRYTPQRNHVCKIMPANVTVILFTRGCFLSICFLLIVGNIETNPGPFTENRDGRWAESENCTWNESNVLGRGATAVVYKGRLKNNGSLCAVKVFHERLSASNSSLPIREMQILRSLNHPNIIGILGIENESKTSNQVLIMELCEGGSLYSMLDQPKYAFGFPEEEFLIVLKQIASGLKCLRQNELIHRDIKPGNILRYIDSNGCSIYKLTDFGAARQLEEEEEFTSIYGTEEYLDPHMYERGVLQNRRGQMFDASVDLWSLEVTIYHVATGQLPFQPYGGRMNTRTMYQMTTEKASGVISGIQRFENGPIEWRRELPATCLLSSCLKSMITLIIAGLLETNPRRRSTFETFFKNVTDIIEMKVLKLFNVSQGSNQRIYINENQRYASFQEFIAKETQIPARDQLILFSSRQLSEVVDAMVIIQQYPISVLQGQLFLFNRGIVENGSLALPEIPSFPDFPSYSNYDKDSSTAKASSSIAHLTQRWVQILEKRQDLLKQSLTHLREYVQSITSGIENYFPRISDLVQETSRRQNIFYSSSECCVVYIDLLQSLCSQSDELSQCIKDNKDKIVKTLTDKSSKDVMQKALTRSQEIKAYMEVLIQKIKDQQNDAINCVGCLEDDNCIQKAKYIQTNISDIWTQFQKHKRQQHLSSNEQFIHNSDRLRLTELCVQLQSLIQGHCLQNYKQLHEVVLKQTSAYLKNLQRTKKVDQNITNVIDCQKRLSERIDKMETDCLDLNSKLQSYLKFKLPLHQLSVSSAKPLTTGVAESKPMASDDSAYKSMQVMSSELESIASSLEDNKTKIFENTQTLSLLLKDFDVKDDKSVIE